MLFIALAKLGAVFAPVNPRFKPTEAIAIVRLADPKLIINSLRGLVASIDGGVPVYRVRAMDDVISDSTASYRFRGMLFGLLEYEIAGVTCSSGRG